MVIQKSGKAITSFEGTGVEIPLFLGFYISQVVQDFFHQQ